MKYFIYGCLAGRNDWYRKEQVSLTMGVTDIDISIRLNKSEYDKEELGWKWVAKRLTDVQQL